MNSLPQTEHSTLSFNILILCFNANTDPF